MAIAPRLLDAATSALARTLSFEHPADAVLSEFFRSEKVLGRRERAFIAEGVYAVLRRKRLLEHLIGTRPTPRRLMLAGLLRVQGIGLRQLQGAISHQETDWAETLLAVEPGAMPLAVRADFPDWLAERLVRDMSEEAVLELARSLNQGAPLDLRVNPLKAEREAVIAQLRSEGIAAEPGRYAPLAIRLKEKPSLQRHALYLSGAVEVQDEGSQLLAYLVAPKRGEMVVDFCAGAGGKTLLLGALMRSTGRLYALDVAEKRLARLRPRVARSGLSNVHPIRIASENDVRVKRLAGKVDRVLVDAPCSGLGTLRRNPDLKWRQSAEGVQELARKQRDILAGAARLVKPGGRLVYATCSILSEENEDVIADFLAAQPDFERADAGAILRAQGIALEAGAELRLSPQAHDTDGFYACVLQRRVAAAAPAAA